MLATMDRTQQHVIALSHEQLAAVLGVGRSYASRFMMAFRAEGIIETKRLEFRVIDESSLRAKSCNCDEAVKAHFSEALKGVYPASMTRGR
jgi:hypothetical protein